MLLLLLPVFPPFLLSGRMHTHASKKTTQNLSHFYYKQKQLVQVFSAPWPWHHTNVRT
jgi:hypothetical protein